MHRAIRPTQVETACCAGYREFTFYGESLPIEAPPTDYAILNKTASNYIHGEVQTLNLFTMVVTIPSLSNYVLDERSVQVLPTTLESTRVDISYPGGNELYLIHPSGADILMGIFTIRIWMDNLTLISWKHLKNY
jgi:hypothetical protein